MSEHTIQLTDNEFNAVINYLINKRNYARDCRWTAKHYSKNMDKWRLWDMQYKMFNKRIQKLRKLR